MQNNQWMLVMAACCLISVEAEAEPNLHGFPPVKEGMVRYVIELPPKPRHEADDLRVELFVGKEILSDGVNYSSFPNLTIEPKSSGYPINYFEVESLGPMCHTLIGVSPTTPLVRTFVTGKSIIVLYNSRIPLVFYVPSDSEVRYRIWTAPDTLRVAEPK